MVACRASAAMRSILKVPHCLRLLPLLVAAWILLGCKTEKILCSPADLTGCVIDDVRITGNSAVGDGEIEGRIATAATGGSLEAVPLVGIIDTLTVQYERFDRFVLERDLQRVARIYRAKGYYDAVVRAGRVRRIDEHEPGSTDVKNARLLVEIVVEEGKPVLVSKVTIEWEAALRPDAETVEAVEEVAKTFEIGAVFAEEQYEGTRAKIQRVLTDEGYAHAKVEPLADVNIRDRKATVRYKTTLGPKCTFGEVRIYGLSDVLPEWQVRPAIGVAPGQPYSTNKLEAAEVALTELGVFGSIAVEPVLTNKDPSNAELPTVIDINVRLQPAYLGSWRVGGGVELGDQVAVRGVVGAAHKNATNALDRIGFDARARGVLYPWRLATIGSGEVRFIPETSGRLQYSMPFPADPLGTLYAQTQVSYGLERNHDPPDEITEDAEVPVEVLVEHKMGYQRKFFVSRLVLSASYNILFSEPFFFPAKQSPGSSLTISYVDLLALLDLRQNEAGKWDKIRPARGILAQVDFQVAGHGLGGDASDLRIRPEFRWYAPLHDGGFVLAGRFTLGFLIPTNYGFTLEDTIDPNSVAITTEGSEAERERVNRDVDILDKRGLFSGGPSSNRGYGFNQIAPHRVVDDEGAILLDPDAIGGRTLWEATIEFRFPIRGAWSGTTFIDASDVTAGVAQFRPDHPHISTGVGVHYNSPIGPLRIELGVRVPYLQVIGTDEVDDCTSDSESDFFDCTVLVIDEAEPTTFLGAPLSLNIALGNAF